MAGWLVIYLLSYSTTWDPCVYTDLRLDTYDTYDLGTDGLVNVNA